MELGLFARPRSTATTISRRSPWPLLDQCTHVSMWYGPGGRLGEEQMAALYSEMALRSVGGKAATGLTVETVEHAGYALRRSPLFLCWPRARRRPTRPSAAQLADRSAQNGPFVSVAPAGWHAMLVAGDNSSPAFDNGVETLHERLTGLGVNTVRTFNRLEGPPATSSQARPMSAPACAAWAVMPALSMSPATATSAASSCAPTGGCSRPRPSIWRLSRAVGRRPRCWSSRPVTAARSSPRNRVGPTASSSPPPRSIVPASAAAPTTTILTTTNASCSSSMRRRPGARWRSGTRSCVETLERRLGVRQESHPQMFFGAEVANLRLPGR